MANAGLYGQFAPQVRSIDDVENALARRDMNALQTQSALMEMQQRQQAAAEAAALRRAVAESGGDPVAMRKALVGGGHAESLMKFDKNQAEVTEIGARTAKEQADTKIKQAQVFHDNTKALAREWSAIDPHNDEQMVQMYETAVKRGLIDTDSAVNEINTAPPPGTPERAAWVAAQKAKAVDVLDQQKQELEAAKAAEAKRQHEAQMAHQAAQLAETQRNHQANERIAGGNLAETKRHHTTIEGQGAAVAMAPEYKQDENGNWVALPKKVVAGQPIVPVPVMTADGKPFGSGAGGAKLTEDQGKATGWLVQVENAFKNLKAVGLDKNGKPTSAAYPGLNDALGAVPSFGLGGAMANQFRSVDRQKFMQASSSLSEALLRAATGAGVNKDEAAQKIRELTPLFGEGEETTKQKFEAIPLYIESLKVRAGPGAKRVEGITERARPGLGRTIRYDARGNEIK